jgi:hypothetical protein
VRALPSRAPAVSAIPAVANRAMARAEEQPSVMDQKEPLNQVLADIRASGAPNSPAAASFEHLSDQGVQRLYENIRHQVEADRAMGGRYRLVGEAAKQRAQRLRAKLVQRGLKFAEIDWP